MRVGHRLELPRVQSARGVESFDSFAVGVHERDVVAEAGENAVEVMAVERVEVRGDAPLFGGSGDAHAHRLAHRRPTGR